MPSTNDRARVSGAAALVVALVVACAARAEAQQQPQGFSLERLYPSAPGGGWVVMDALDMRGGLGGAATMSLGYAHNPLQVATSDGSQHLAVVTKQASAGFGFAVTYDRFRLYLNMDMPLVTKGDVTRGSDTVANYTFSPPTVDVGTNPDLLTDARVGFDTRILGDARSPFRLGAGAQLFVPNGTRADYVTDGSYRAMARVLFAGDVGALSYAAHLGVHVRPLDDAPAPGSPQGSELLFGVAAGPRLRVSDDGRVVVVVGPEIFGATAFRSFFGTTTTALEGLLTGRLEGTAEHGAQIRVKLGAGGGMNAHFGAPEWRMLFAIEVFDHGGGPRTPAPLPTPTPTADR